MILLLGSFGNLLVEASLDPCSPCEAQYPADPSRKFQSFTYIYLLLKFIFIIEYYIAVIHIIYTV